MHHNGRRKNPLSTTIDASNGFFFSKQFSVLFKALKYVLFRTGNEFVVVLNYYFAA